MISRKVKPTEEETARAIEDSKRSKIAEVKRMLQEQLRTFHCPDCGATLKLVSDSCDLPDDIRVIFVTHKD